MTPTVLKAINRQIASELTASYAYLAMSAYCEQEKFTGAARWLRLQSQEEYMHALKLFDFVLARDGEIQLESIPKPHAAFRSVAQIFERALAQEQGVSEQINSLYELAFKERAFAEMAELQWFLTEQVEEEKTARQIVAKFKMVGDDPASLLDLDRELGGRSQASNPSA